MTAPLDPAAAEVLVAWFGTTALEGPIDPAVPKRWFTVDPDFDESLRARFEPLVSQAARGELRAWEDSPAGALAVVILLDQFTRNLYRDDPRAFEADPVAREVAARAIAKGYDKALSMQPRSFFYLPFEHAEDRDLQARAVSLFQAMVDAATPDERSTAEYYLSYAVRHQVVIDRFGRFPHRNRVLGRESTPAEREHLDAGKTF